jgi:hypothetical protein
MIAKISSFSLIFLVAIIFAQVPCGDEFDKCSRVINLNPCEVGAVICTPNQCQTGDGTCLPDTGCVFTNYDNYPPHSCNDGDLCTIDDSCINGECFGFEKICDDVCLENEACEPTTGECRGTPVVCKEKQCYVTPDCRTDIGGCVYNELKPEGSSCDTGLTCTTDSCVAGQCTSQPMVCPPQPCMSALCNPATDRCEYTPMVCNDDNLCTTDSCVAGQCVYTTKDCNDNNACTTDTCVAGQCVNTPKVCNDNNACTTDTCVAGQCVSTQKDCNDNNTCTTDTCVAGQCVNTPKVCNDNNACTTDTCVAGQCVSTPLDCNDNNLCTADSCVAGKCMHKMMNCTRTGSNVCQFNNGTCNPTTGQCVYASKPNGTTCDDSNLCTTKDKCTSGQCGGTNTCCMNRTKNKCGICVSDCCSEYGKVLSFFGLRGYEYDVTEVSGSGCSGSTVCCAPVSQSIFTYQSDKCVVRKA